MSSGWTPRLSKSGFRLLEAHRYRIVDPGDSGMAACDGPVRRHLLRFRGDADRETLSARTVADRCDRARDGRRVVVPDHRESGHLRLRRGLHRAHAARQRSLLALVLLNCRLNATFTCRRALP